MKAGVLAAVFALAAAPSFAQGDPAVAKVRAAYEKAANAQDAAAAAKLYAPDGVEMAPNAPAAKGRAAIEALHKAFAAEWMQHGMTLTSTETKVSGDIAYDTGTYKQQLMSKKSGGMMDDKGKYVVLLKKDPSGAWVITHAIYNSDIPPPAAPAKK